MTVNKIIWMPSLALAVVWTAVYWYRCHRTGNKFDIGVIVNALANSFLAVGGALLLVSFFSEEIKRLLGDPAIYAVYAAIGGAVSVVVSVRNFYREVIKDTEKRPNAVAE